MTKARPNPGSEHDQRRVGQSSHYATEERPPSRSHPACPLNADGRPDLDLAARVREHFVAQGWKWWLLERMVECTLAELAKRQMEKASKGPATAKKSEAGTAPAAVVDPVEVCKEVFGILEPVNWLPDGGEAISTAECCVYREGVVEVVVGRREWCNRCSVQREQSEFCDQALCSLHKFTNKEVIRVDVMTTTSTTRNAESLEQINAKFFFADQF